MSSFQDLGFFVYINPVAEAQKSYAHAALKDRRRVCALLLLGFCLRVTVNEKP